MWKSGKLGPRGPGRDSWHSFTDLTPGPDLCCMGKVDPNYPPGTRQLAFHHQTAGLAREDGPQLPTGHTTAGIPSPGCMPCTGRWTPITPWAHDSRHSITRLQALHGKMDPNYPPGTRQLAFHHQAAGPDPFAWEDGPQLSPGHMQPMCSPWAQCHHPLDTHHLRKMP